MLFNSSDRDFTTLSACSVDSEELKRSSAAPHRIFVSASTLSKVSLSMLSKIPFLMSLSWLLSSTTKLHKMVAQ